MARRILVWLAVVSVTSPVARADLHPPFPEPVPRLAALGIGFSSPGPYPASHNLENHCVSAEPRGELASEPWSSGYCGDSPLFASALAGFSQHAPAQTSERVIRQLPGLPGSAELLLSAMLTVGVCHLTRGSVRHLKLASVPDWFHAEGPTQVGHAVSFDFDFTALPPCCFEQPAGQRPFLHRVRRDQRPRCDALSFFIITAPRGPPTPRSAEVSVELRAV